jgi:hypothetical protein
MFTVVQQYTGTRDSICPITLKTLEEIQSPVAFRNASHQPYECDDLMKWLMEKEVNPMTNLPVYWTYSPLEIMAPLSICKNPKFVSAHIEKTLILQPSEIVPSLLLYILMLALATTVWSTDDVCRYWSHICINTIALIHTICSMKKVKGFIVAISGAYVLVTVIVIITFKDGISFPVNAISIIFVFIKIASHWSDTGMKGFSRYYASIFY